MPANATPLAPSHPPFFSATLTGVAVGITVPKVTVAVVAAPSVTLPGETPQVGIVAPATVAIAQLRLTVPANPPVGVTVTVEFPLAPRLATFTVVGFAAKVNVAPASGLTVTLTAVDELAAKIASPL